MLNRMPLTMNLPHKVIESLTQVWPFHPENQKFHHYF